MWGVWVEIDLLPSLPCLPYLPYPPKDSLPSLLVFPIFPLSRLLKGIQLILVVFDLTMSILAHNLYRLLALDLEGYSHLNATSVFEKFICNSGQIRISEDAINVTMKIRG